MALSCRGRYTRFWFRGPSRIRHGVEPRGRFSRDNVVPSQNSIARAFPSLFVLTALAGNACRWSKKGAVSDRSGSNTHRTPSLPSLRVAAVDWPVKMWQLFHRNRKAARHRNAPDFCQRYPLAGILAAPCAHAPPLANFTENARPAIVAPPNWRYNICRCQICICRCHGCCVGIALWGTCLAGIPLARSRRRTAAALVTTPFPLWLHGIFRFKQWWAARKVRTRRSAETTYNLQVPPCDPAETPHESHD